mmetsp:Transcript_7395/g.10280  ORF Transcript_7395/g.10280 Transcript_7395/m.10280 type:complete len:661 (+) Transcript_7395:1869-3851(+)|eukprot:CAMPEP_0197303708 /NCGR_PEP_ID=MMETSP0890-20130614/51827_1 /TAXON_ID=44058 ORGANISM="Aureoumbra lagunensis, Strain CCMP1510" /NCGR_SAMPLE_ID=MMETSP0890 /ASSEMBLY_ACC=CAM_ASM_000533 /LENGTH=660 /DNA_ID=CAMNT_0042783601 /DNA_START=3226 /DNA_END=5208 /DNA_ORIENTATION=-
MSANADERKEASSQSNYLEAWAEHMELELLIDFDQKKLRGSVIFHVVRSSRQVNEFIVDTSGGLNILGASVDGKTTVVKWQPEHPVFGRAAAVALDAAEKNQVRFEFETGNKCSGAQWLTAEQTQAKMPFLFTQSQAIHARSLFPCQDAPGAKLTYSISLTCPAWATALTCGLKLAEMNKGKNICTQWNQPVKTSTYLIAFACGVLKSYDLSNRCRVWAEPSVIDSAAYEFADTEKFLTLAEEITQFTYAWTRYDLVCLPASFPYGGMENCNLTFVTPTLLAGDRSLAGVVAHEIAHSWTGNLVTNQTWNAFWLNEGWTRWLERQILAHKTSPTDAKIRKQLIDFDRSMARAHLAEDVVLFQERNKQQLTALVPLLQGVDPDDAFSSVPYEKGSGLLHYLEHLVGYEQFLSFFQAYLKKFAHSTITSHQFAQFFQDQFPKINVDWEIWFHAFGVCPKEAPLDTTLVLQVQRLASAWMKDSAFPISANDDATIKAWPTDLKSFFLDTLLAIPPTELEQKLPLSTLDALDDRFNFSNSNSELQFRFFRLLLRTTSPRALPLALRMATTQGRMKFVRPLYRAACACPIPGALDAALTAFEAHEAFYHPICRKLVAADLEHALTSQQEELKTKKVRSDFIRTVGLLSIATVAFLLLARARGRGA